MKWQSGACQISERALPSEQQDHTGPLWIPVYNGETLAQALERARKNTPWIFEEESVSGDPFESRECSRSFPVG